MLHLDKLIEHRGILHERTEDAPFMGALIIATECNNRCRECFNQHLRDTETYLCYASDIISQVKSNPFNEGIILSGLEWSEHADDAIALISCAKEAGLHVMLYSGLDENQLLKRIPEIYLSGCYIKVGKYDNQQAVQNYKSCGVSLASSNQYVRLVD